VKLYIESALRIWGRLLICAALVFALAWGVLYLAKAGDYSSWATVWVEKPLYIESDLGSNPYVNPATTQANLLNELLRTRQFTLGVAQGAKIPMPNRAAEDSVVTGIQRDLSIEASGHHLVRLNCTAGKENHCKEVITQAIRLFIEELVTNRARQAEVALQVYESQLATYEEQMLKSRDEYNRYLLANPNAGLDEVANPTFAELQQRYRADRDRYESVMTKIEQIKTQSIAATEANNSFFRVMDPASDALPYTFSMRDLLRNSLIAGALALMTIIALTLVSAWADPAVHTLNDINALVMDEEETAPELLISTVPYNKTLASIRQHALKERKGEGKAHADSGQMGKGGAKSHAPEPASASPRAGAHIG
jgi:hypothetical protein